MIVIYAKLLSIFWRVSAYSANAVLCRNHLVVLSFSQTVPIVLPFQPGVAVTFRVFHLDALLPILRPACCTDLAGIDVPVRQVLVFVEVIQRLANLASIACLRFHKYNCNAN